MADIHRSLVRIRFEGGFFKNIFLNIMSTSFRWICDGEADCGSGDTSDEDPSMCQGAVSCLRNEFQCR